MSKENKKDSCKLDQWYDDFIQKKAEDIDIRDVYHMLSQNIFIDIAIKKSIQILWIDPLAGEMYDGQLLELLSLVDADQFKDVSGVQSLLKHIDDCVPHLEWFDEEDKEEYNSVLCILAKKINNIEENGN